MKYKQIVISLLIGLVLGLSTNAFAAVGDTVQAVYAQFNYVVNGVSQPPGVTALVYDGTSYLRTTDLGNMLGYDVTYKANSRTIEFNNNKPVTATPTPAAATAVAPAGSPTPTPSPGATPTVTPTPAPTPVGQTPSPTPVGWTPSPTPVGTATPAPSATPVPSVTPTPTPIVAATPVPVDVPGGDANRMAYCRSIPRDSIEYQLYGCHW